MCGSAHFQEVPFDQLALAREVQMGGRRPVPNRLPRLRGGESVGVGTSDPLRNPSTKNRWGIYRGNSPAIFGVSALWEKWRPAPTDSRDPGR